LPRRVTDPASDDSVTTKHTQKLILDTAVDLFNLHGTAQISANRIADTCQLSRGHLYYHFKRKEEIIHAIYAQIATEMKHNDDLKKPTAHHLLEMFHRYLGLVWRYRFFYREMTALLATDPALQQSFSKNRRQRTQVVIQFFAALIDNEVLLGPRDPQTLANLVAASWMICDNWINYVSADGPTQYPECADAGFRIVIDLFKPYLSPQTLVTLDCSLARATHTLRKSASG
jgi:AcrR family transcriptional regulator